MDLVEKALCEERHNRKAFGMVDDTYVEVEKYRLITKGNDHPWCVSVNVGGDSGGPIESQYNLRASEANTLFERLVEKYELEEA